MPRSGLQYGAHNVLYKRHPALCHSDYAVVVMPPEVRPSTLTRPCTLNSAFPADSSSTVPPRAWLDGSTR
jgi:hypothetical protein